MKSVTFYKTVAIICFIILSSVQYYLVYNTYKLKDEQYFLSEKDTLNEQYSLSVLNDKVYPGGQKIIDSIIYRNIKKLEYVYINDKNNFNNLKDKVCDTIITHLRLYSNMDSLFSRIVKDNNLNPNLQYLLTVTGISISFSGNNRNISLYKPNIINNDIDSNLQRPQGIIIDGTLKYPNKQNIVTPLNITSPFDYSYDMSFYLFVDNPNRNTIIFMRMLPTLLLSVFSILFILLLYFLTYRNWLKQKKLAEMQSDFVNSVTHEFNTPLSTIIVANKNLQNKNIYNDGKLILPLTNIIERQAQRLKTLFSRVIDITKMNEATLDKKEYIFSDLIDEVLLDYRLTLNDKNVRLNLANHTNEEHVFLDKFWFTTMLLNIFENAIKYNKNSIKEIDVIVSKIDNLIELNVKDNGIGMSRKTINHIFDKFYRSKEHDMQEASGLGLGLYYAKQCINAHNWKIDIVSTEGNGTNFIIYIPIE